MGQAALDPETLLNAYAQGAFPMADEDGAVRWYTANPRGVIPLESFRASRSLRAVIRHQCYELRVNGAFERTMRACMERRAGQTWINERLIRAYVQLHQLGFAHSVESWQGGELAGGLYGVALGGAFFGESMFHLRRDASKVALCHLVQRLREREFVLLDTQASTPHLKQFGCVEMPAEEYLARLRAAIPLPRRFD
jgi:leucyl/phenylalanyl-tRNA--protein transferase